MEAVAEVDSLVEKIVALAADLNNEELARCKLLLGIAAGGLAPHGQVPSHPKSAAALKTVIRCLAKLQPTGIAWRGKPDFLDAGTFANLQAEAVARRFQAEKVDRYLLSAGRAKANDLIASKSFNQFLANNCSTLSPSGLATYIYYEGAGSGLDPHLDSDSFGVNFIMVLEHHYKTTPSHLLIYGPDSEPERILVAPGEGVILYAGSTIHAREDLQDDEKVTLLTVGLKY